MRTYRFTKGLRLDKHEWELEEGELPELTNFIYGEDRSSLRKRNGFQRVVPSVLGVSPIRGIYRASVNGTTPHTLVVSGGTLYRVLDPSPSWDSIHTGLTASTPVRFDSWKEEVFFVTGADELHAWNGSSVRVVNGAPVGCRFVQQHQDRLFLASSAQFPDTVFYSELLDPDTWEHVDPGDPELPPIANIIDVSTGDNEKITGLVRTRDRLTVFKTNATYYLLGYDPEEWVLRKVTDGLGCVAPGSIVEMDARTIWLSDRGVYMDDGESFYRVGTPIQPIINTIPRSDQEQAVAVVSGWNYYLFFPQSPYGPIGFVYNVVLEAWSYWELAVPISAACRRDLPTDDDGWMVGAMNQGQIFYGNRGGTDDGLPIHAKLSFAGIGDVTPDVQLDLRRIALDGIADGADEMKLKWSVDGGDINERLFTGSKATIFSVPVNVGQKLKLSVEIEGTGTESMIRGIAADVRVKRRFW